MQQREKAYKKLVKEVQDMNRTLHNELAKILTDKTKIEERIDQEEDMLCQQSDFRIQAVEITRLAAIKRDETDQKSRERMKAEERYKKALEDLKAKDNQIEDHKKQLREFNHK